jgi:hypothetical protein
VIVTAYDSNDIPVTTALTSPGGVYALDTNLVTGSYRVGFDSPARALDDDVGYLTRFYSDKNTLAAATAVAVTAPNTTQDIDQALVRCGSGNPSTTTTTAGGGTTTTTLGGESECGDPAAPFVAGAGSANAVTASDALFILRASVSLEICPLCVCDVNNSGSVSATDALTALQFAVGLPVTIDCPVCS